jgi:uncharacterized protein YbaP (TraB family)
MKNIVFSALLCLGFSSYAFAESSVWKVESNGAVTYLGGTCHVLRKSDYPLPEEFLKAYEESEIVVFETDISKLSSPEVQMMFLQKGALPDGSTLQSVLSPETYSALDKYCAKAGIPLSALGRLKPPLVVLTLLGLELQKLGVNESGVDEFFHKRATAEGKDIEWMESVEEQIGYVLSMGEGQEDDFVKQSLKDLEETETIIGELISAWRGGDEDGLVEVMIDEMRSDFPDLYEAILVERNRNWAPKIKEYMRTPEQELLLVGVAHLVGEDGIIKELRDSGFTVTKLELANEPSN